MDEVKNNKKKITQKWHLSEFQHSEEFGIYVPPEKAMHTISYSDGTEIENYILNTIKNAKDISNDSDELMRAVKDWPSYYHLGIGRSNIFKALDIPTSAKVLELGSGCGALTRYLGENFKSVDGVEGGLLRAQIARERCRDLKNTKIFCSNFKNIKFDATYDIVTLIGVLEYAPVYFSDQYTKSESCLNLLKLAKTALKDDGVLIIAIENKIGIKYWSGCPEDHTGKIFDSIHGYPSNQSPATFSKREIKTLLKVAGFSNILFYYCFPDYKFASTIISDIGDEKDFYLHNWIEIPFTSYNDVPRNYTFHEGLAIKTLSKSGLLREFANSFLIVAGRSDTSIANKPDWIAKKFSVRRHKEFRCVTTLKTKPRLHVEKKKLFNSKESTASNNIVNIKHKVVDSPWYEGDLVIFEVFESIYKTNFKKKILELLEKYYQELIDQYFMGVSDEEGYPLLQGPLIDFTFRNIIKKDKKLLCIDNEWWAENIPIDYILYRCITSDIINLQKPWIIKKIGNIDKFAIELMKHFFPNYGNIRHNKNKTLEESIQDLVSGGLNPRIMTGKFQFLRRKTIWSLIMSVWSRLPENTKSKIKKWIRTVDK